MAKTFRLGIFGAGMITKGSHLPAALASTKVEVTALVDPVVDRARTLAQSFGIDPLCVGDPSEVLDKIDGAVIATPNHTHCDLALKCLGAGLPVLIEKPLAVTVAEGERISRAAADAGRVVSVGYTTRFYDAVALLGRLIESDYFGRIHRFLYQYGTPGGWAPMSSYHLDRGQSGGGVLVVTATHFLDRMLAWFGYPDQVEYTDDAIDGPEANCWARFRFDQDGHELIGEIRLSKALALKGGVVLDTERGRVVLGEHPHAPLVLIPAGHDDLRHELTSEIGGIGALSPGQAQLEDFVRACHGGPPPLVGAEQALQSMRLLEALYACRTPLETDLYRAKPEADERKTTCGP